MIHKTIPIWNDEREFMPTLTTYILDDCLAKERENATPPRKRGAVLIFPGGGYYYCSPREAEPVALQFMSAGFHAFVLEYTTRNSDPNGRWPQPLLDASRAMTIIRENASKWNVDPNNIAVCGFSAGGHLAASLGTMWNRDYIKSCPEIGDNKPNALILGYPAINPDAGPQEYRDCFRNLSDGDVAPDMLRELSVNLNVTPDTPPTFLWHTVEDSLVPVKNALLFANALDENNVSFEAHIYPYGVHGLSLGTEETGKGELHVVPHIANWIALAIKWLKL